MNTNEMIESLRGSSSEVEEKFGAFNEEQLNWKPSADEWSVGQCLDHLVVTGKEYFPIIEGALAGKHNSTIWEKLPLLPTLGGNFILNAVQPENTRKNSAPGVFKPSSSDIPADVIQKLVATNDELIEWFQKTDGLETDKMVVASPISKMFTYKLATAMEIVVVHERRHILQAQRVVEAEGFPK